MPQVITEIRPYDIICGRNSTAFNNIGNRRFRITISLNLRRYDAAVSREMKSQVIISVVKVLRDNGARFLKRIGKNQWVDVGDKRAREKVGHALRDTSVQLSNSKAQSDIRKLEKIEKFSGFDKIQKPPTTVDSMPTKLSPENIEMLKSCAPLASAVEALITLGNVH